MGTNFIRTNKILGSIGTTKLLSITSSETLYTIESGNIALEVTNLGSYTVYYGNSGVLANSGGILNSNGSKFWDTVAGNFSLRFAVGSGGITGRVLIQEYVGN